MVSPHKVWKLKPPTPRAAELAREAGITPLQARLLINRGIGESGAAQSFLSPRLSQMADPMLMKGMEGAVKTILATVEARDKITIYGDYDADGLTATAVLVHFFSDIGVAAEAYIPNRLEEGYGLNREAVEQIGRNGTGLIITVDCGISGTKEVGLAQAMGLDVVVTDHHQLSGRPVPPCPVVNPHQPDCPFPFKGLSGVGLAFFLSVSVRAALRAKGWFRDRTEPDLREYLDLVALGTVADRVPLTGQNRILVRAGLGRIADSRWPGIRAMMDVAGVRDTEISTDDLAFRLAPRLNAPGRLGDSHAGLEILTVPGVKRAAELAGKINLENARRQQMEQSILDRIEEMIRARKDLGGRRVLILWGENWHQGVLGIVASRLVEKYHRPSLVVGVKDGIATGSGRSIDGFNLYKALSRLPPLFQRFGGHAHAAGFTLDEENLEILESEIEALARRELAEEALTPAVEVDSDLSLSDISREMIHQIMALAPFGEGNPDPVFRSRSLEVLGSRVVGGRHLKLRVRQGGTILDAIGFSFGHRFSLNGRRIDMVFTPELNRYRGSEKVQLRVVDLKICNGT